MFAWTKECHNIRVVLTGPFIRVGVSDSRGMKKRGRREGRAEFHSK